MPDPLEYVITRAMLQCSEGTVPMPFVATPRRVRIQRMAVGTAVDKTPLVNIPPFVICRKLTQMAGSTANGAAVPVTDICHLYEEVDNNAGYVARRDVGR